MRAHSDRFHPLLLTLVLVACGDKDGDGTAVVDGDGDGDGYAEADDCDDDNADVHPGATEVCDGIDNDCDDQVDDADTGVDPSTQTTAYPDADGDGYGDALDAGSLFCEIPAGFVADNTDCEDGVAAVNPSATEVCDGHDTDCSSATSEAGTATFTDDDGVVTDYTGTLTGSASAAAEVTLSTAGELAVCEGTWYVHLDVAADVDIVNPSGAPADVVLDGTASGTVVSISTDGVHLSLDGVTLQNGAGNGDALPVDAGRNGGGIDCTATGSTLSATSVDLLDNTASEGAGGGLASNGCTIDIEDAVISGNSAGLGAGLYASNGAVTLSNSVISDNRADFGGGGLMVDDGSGTAMVTLDEVEVTDNVASRGGGAYLIDNEAGGASVTCAGSTASAAGFTGNSGAGVYLFGPADLVSDSCDFGTYEAGDDNRSGDVEIHNGPTLAFLGDDESFACTDGTCPTVDTHTIGGTANFTILPALFYGNVIEADTDADILQFGIALGSSSCSADFYVLSASSPTSTSWTVEWVRTAVSLPDSIPARYATLRDVRVEVSSGTSYMLAVGTNCTSGAVSHYYDTGASNRDAGFGTSSGFVYSDRYSGPLSVGDTYTVAEVSDEYGVGGIFGQEVVVWQ